VEEGGGGEGGGGGARDTESKTRTPHKDVGKNSKSTGYLVLSCVMYPVYQSFCDQNPVVLLRNSALNVALGQLIIAGAVCVPWLAKMLSFMSKMEAFNHWLSHSR